MVGTIVLTFFSIIIQTQALDLSGCGTTKGCVTSPSACMTSSEIGCDLAFTYQTDDSGKIYMELFAKRIESENLEHGQYIAVGFSDDQAMGEDTVIQCVHLEFAAEPRPGMEVAIEAKNHMALSENDGKTNEYIGQIEDVYSLEVSYTAETGMLCSVSGNSSLFDLPEAEIYVLLATGTVANPAEGGTQLNMHSLASGGKTRSEQKIDILKEIRPETLFIDPLDLSTCGTDKGCVTSPPGCENNNDCELAFTFRTDESGQTTLELFAKTLPNMFAGSGEANQYVAIGFSKDAVMGDDTVLQCETPPPPGTEIQFHNDAALSKNTGKNNEYIGNLAFTAEEHSYTDEGFLCRLIADNAFFNSFGAPNSDEKYPLGGQKYILVATGTVANPEAGTKLNMHTLERSRPDFPVVSSKMYDILKDFNKVPAPEPEPEPEGAGNFRAGFVCIFAVVVTLAFLQ